ncbi:hypothetical protein, partial [Candidatus Villigracilis affinis]|uniref:hypothetical protein n=1 Tax=Candidatus Villigracilis affinis TaxID=3140682 RepID=UPI0031EACD64
MRRNCGAGARKPAYPKHTLRRRHILGTFSVSLSGAVCACWLGQDSFAFKQTICIFFLPPNGLRYPRWGGTAGRRPPGKMLRRR